MNKLAILSRYKENNHTFREILDSYGYNTIVFNKHQGDNLLSNVGREGHTYIKYIVDNYNNLPDEILFSQYDPMDHFHKKNYMKQRNNEHISLFLNSYLYDFITINPKDYDLYVRRKKINWIKYSEILFDCNITRSFINKLIATSASLNGVFRVTKQAILKHDLALYVRALSMLDKHVNPDEGFYFERIWKFLFTDYGHTTDNFENLKDYTFIFGNHIADQEHRLRKDNAFGHIKLYSDGTISSNRLSYYQHPNESYWTCNSEKNEVYLYIFNIMSAITSKFNISSVDLEDHRLYISGDYYDNSRSKIHKNFFWLRYPMWKDRE